MLYLYTTQENAPSSLRYVHNIETYFTKVAVPKVPYVTGVLSEIEGGSYIDEIWYRDRFGANLYLSALSTTSKILITAYSEQNILINAVELGLNGIAYLFDNKEQAGDIHLIVGSLLDQYCSLKDDDLVVDVNLDGSVCRTIYDLSMGGI